MSVAAVATSIMSLLHRSSVYDLPLVIGGLSGLVVVLLCVYVPLRGGLSDIVSRR